MAWYPDADAPLLSAAGIPDVITNTVRSSTGARYPLSSHGGKRALDVLLSVLLLTLSLPLLALVALAIRLDSPGPVFFRQRRVGRGGRPFTLVKFRTMRWGTPDLPTDQMARLPSPVTRVGRRLRRLSLDELPQLWNVLLGEMSLVGPRPALATQADLNE